MNAMNSFENPINVVPVEFSDLKIADSSLEFNMPAKSVIVFELNGKLNSQIGEAVKADNPKPQLKYQLYEGNYFTLSDFTHLKPVREGSIELFKLPEDNWGLILQ